MRAPPVFRRPSMPHARTPARSRLTGPNTSRGGRLPRRCPSPESRLSVWRTVLTMSLMRSTGRPRQASQQPNTDRHDHSSSGTPDRQIWSQLRSHSLHDMAPAVTAATAPDELSVQSSVAHLRTSDSALTTSTDRRAEDTLDVRGSNAEFPTIRAPTPHSSLQGMTIAEDRWRDCCRRRDRICISTANSGCFPIGLSLGTSGSLGRKNSPPSRVELANATVVA
jgi:hypothetical protein